MCWVTLSNIYTYRLPVYNEHSLWTKALLYFSLLGILNSFLQVLQKLLKLSQENTAFATTLIITVPFKGFFTCAVQLNALQIISQKLLQQCLWNSSNDRLTDSGPFWPFQKRLTSVSSFCASLLQMIAAVTSLVLGPQVVSQAPQHFRSPNQLASITS